MTAEAGSIRLGTTVRESRTGGQVFWFKSLADFEKHKFNVFEMKHGHTPPVPMVEMIPGESAAPDQSGIVVTMQKALEDLGMWVGYTDDGNVVIRRRPTDEELAAGGFWVPEQQDANVSIEGTGTMPTANVSTFAPPPPPPSFADAIFAAHGGRKIRLNDFAAELQIEPDDLKKIIISDSRYKEIHAGWVSLA